MARGEKRGGQMEKTLRVGLYARVATHDQQTPPMQPSSVCVTLAVRQTRVHSAEMRV